MANKKSTLKKKEEAKGDINFPKVIFNVAWIAIALGLAMELLLLIIAAGFGKTLTSGAVIADSVQKVTWSFFVCTGVALGTIASRMRAQFMGLAGLIAAPIAFTVAKAMHKSTAQALSIPIAAITGPSPLLLAAIKGVEYAALGAILGWYGSKLDLKFKWHLTIGLAIGVLFGGIIIFIVVGQTIPAMALSGKIALSANELIFPVGCATVLYTAQQIGARSR